MIIAVRTMGEVEVPADHIVYMVAMWNGVVPAIRTMAMPGLVSVAGMRGSASCWIVPGNGEYMLVDVVVMDVVEMAVVQVVGMAVMRDRLVATACCMTVRMMVMNRMGAHRRTPSVKGG